MTKPPTILDVAKRAGVSKSQVSRALLGLDRVSPEARAAVRQAAEELGYVGNQIAANLSGSSTTTIGIVVSDLSFQYFSDLCAQLSELCSNRGFAALVTVTGRRNEADVSTAMETLLRYRVDGLIILGGGPPSAPLIAFASTLPVVVIARKASHPDFSSVNAENARGGTELARLVIAKGHRHVAVWTVSEAESATVHARTAAMVRTLTKAGAQVTRLDQSQANPESKAAEIAALLPTVSAAMLPNDHLAVRTLGALHGLGVRVPEDVSVTGFDGIPVLFNPREQLTTFSVLTKHLARTAIEELGRRIGGAKSQAIVVPGAVITGTTLASIQ